MALIKKKIYLFVFLLVNVAPFLYGMKPSIRWLTPFLRNQVISKMVSELFLSIYQDYGNQVLKKLKKESEQLKIKNKKLLKKLQCQEDRLRKSPEFFKEKHKLQLDLK